MYTTTNRVAQLTGITVTAAQVQQAQGIVEMYTGRSEDEVESARDLTILAYATAYQAAYMTENGTTVFNQVRTTSTGEGDFLASFDTKGDAPFIAPLTEIACRHLSWKGSKSVRTGRNRSTRVTLSVRRPWSEV